MLRKILLLAGAAGALTASTAMAEEHVILIMPEAYFPAITYLDPGDTVRFINTTGSEQNIIAKNDAWSVGPIAAGADETLPITVNQQATFYNVASEAEDGSGYTISGNFNYGSAPLN